MRQGLRRVSFCSPELTFNYILPQVAETLSLFLPESPFYAVLSQLPPPDSTNPTSSTTLFAQTAVNDSLPILKEIISIVEQDEAAKINTEVEKRRQRLNAQGPQQIMKEVGREVWSASKVSHLPLFCCRRV